MKKKTASLLLLYKKVLLVGTCLFIFSGLSFCQKKIYSSKYIAQFLGHEPHYAKINFTIDDSTAANQVWLGTPNFNKNTKMVLRDSFNNFYTFPGAHEGQFFYDTSASCILWYYHPFNAGISEKKTVNLDSKQFYKNFDPNKMLVEQLTVDDTLVWIQHSDNNWFLEYDTLTIIQKEAHKVLNWNYHKKGKLSQSFEKTTLLNSEQETELIRVEKMLYYPEGMKHTRFKGCDSCRGTASAHYLQSKSFKKFYQEPTCVNHFWLALRTKLLEHE